MRDRCSSLGEEEEIGRALILGLRDYIRKCGFSDVVLGLSGGIDSALTAAIAVEALGTGARHRHRHAVAVLVAGLRR